MKRISVIVEVRDDENRLTGLSARTFLAGGMFGRTLVEYEVGVEAKKVFRSALADLEEGIALQREEREFSDALQAGG
jgi:hypothetical protein